MKVDRFTRSEATFENSSVFRALSAFALVWSMVVGCSNALNQQQPPEATQIPKTLTEIDDLKVIYYPQDPPLEVPEDAFSKVAMLSALKQQQFEHSEERPPGLAEWGIIAYSSGTEAFRLDLYGGQEELAHDAANDRYFYWDYWKTFEQELIHNKSEFASYVNPVE
ncbi:hypothetical protein DTL42_03795 [Bremerella cremea]|uniref:Uncharacterized protein n=2 Tax=Bremerella cremea TaxID=1031537 RepID=A0A368KV52_9BACT|nr:hypothetical protein DTL42_03795 [Bremerella cremea]